MSLFLSKLTAEIFSLTDRLMDNVDPAEEFPESRALIPALPHGRDGIYRRNFPLFCNRIFPPALPAQRAPLSGEF